MKIFTLFCSMIVLSGCATAPAVQERQDALLMQRAVQTIQSYLAHPDHGDVAGLLTLRRFPEPSEQTVRIESVTTEDEIISLARRFDLSDELKSLLRQKEVTRAAYGTGTCGYYLIEALMLSKTYEVLAIQATPGE